MSKSKSKNHFRSELLGTSIFTDADKEIKSSRLPTVKQTLLCCLAHLETKAIRESANLTAVQIKSYYDKARVPTIMFNKITDAVMKLHKQLTDMSKIPKEKREKPAQKQKIEEFKQYLEKTFKVWPRDAFDRIDNEEDRQFLQSMATDRKASMVGTDESLSKIEQKRHQRKMEEERRQQKHSNLSSSKLIELESSQDEESEEEVKDTKTPETKRIHKRKRVGSQVLIPPDILTKESIVSLSTRMNISPAQQAALTQAIIHESGGDISCVASSYASCDRSRRTKAKHISEEIKSSWKAPICSSIHWDGKQMSSLKDKYKKEERLPVLAGTKDNMKLLGSANYCPGTSSAGQTVSDSVINLVRDWNCQDAIVSMCFDTTAANTGHLSGACICLQQDIGKALLWCACRHHIGELIIGHVFDDLGIEVSKSPEVTLFQRFRKHFDAIVDLSHGFHYGDLEDYNTDAQEVLMELRENVLDNLDNKTTFARDDYKEFYSLCRIILEQDTKKKKLNHPGALHKARWMAKLLYSIKMIILKDHIFALPKGSVFNSEDQYFKLREFVVFVVHLYCAWWVNCASSAINAPEQDLMLYKSILKYRAVSEIVSQSAKKAFDRHLWYLTSELSFFSVFSSTLSVSELKDIAEKLLESKGGHSEKRYGNGFGKPKFPENINLSTKLSDLVDEASWRSIDLLGLRMSFLDKPVEEWCTNVDFIYSKSIVSGINIVNDCSERAVRLTSDFQSCSRNEENFQNILQVVEKDRKKQPNLRKRLKLE